MEIERAENHFVCRLLPPRPTFAQDMNDEERALMDSHAGYYEELMKTGRMVIYGPVRDFSGAWGLGVMEAESEGEARTIAEADPAVVAGIMTVEIGTMPVALIRR